MKKKCIFFVLFIVCAFRLHGSQHKSAQEISTSVAATGFAQASAALKSRAAGIHVESGYIAISHPPSMTIAKVPSANQAGAFKNLQKQYNAKLALEELLYMKEFFALANITAAEWQKIYFEAALNYRALEVENIANIKSVFDQPLEEKIKRRIAKILIDYSIDPSSIVIIRDDTNASVCWIMRTLLMVNQEVLAAVCPMTFEAIIFHEVMHKLYDDPYISACMEDYFNEKKVAQNQVAAFYKKWRLFCERRADIMAALKSIDHAKALIQFFSQLKQCCHAEYHPTHKERAAYLTQVLQEMEIISKV